MSGSDEPDIPFFRCIEPGVEPNPEKMREVRGDDDRRFFIFFREAAMLGDFDAEADFVSSAPTERTRHETFLPKACISDHISGQLSREADEPIRFGIERLLSGISRRTDDERI